MGEVGEDVQQRTIYWTNIWIKKGRVSGGHIH
jgi:hypothetical protein